MTRWAAAIVLVTSGLALSISGCGHGGASATLAGGQPGASGAKGGTIELAQDLRNSPGPVGAAWIAFAASRAVSWDGDGAARKGFGVDGYALELKSRNDLAEIWKEQRAKGAPPDPYLDLLAQIHEAGRMREYVITQFSVPGWTVPAADVAALDLPAFQRLAENALAGRKPELLGTTRSRFKPGGPSHSAGVPGADVPGPDEIAPNRVPCSRSGAAVASGLRRWEVEERALEGAPLAVSSQEEVIAVLAKPPEALALKQRGVTLVSPKVGLLLFVAGYCASEARQPGEAERYIRRAVAMDPLNVDFRGELSFALIGLKRLDDADREIDAGLSLANNDCDRGFFWRKRGYILIDRGNLADAYRAYSESLKFDPGSEIARSELSLIVSQIRQKGGYDSTTLKSYEPPPPAEQMTVKQCRKR